MIWLLLDILQQLITFDERVFLAVNGWHSAYWDTFMCFFSDKLVWIPLYLALAFVVYRNYSLRNVLICFVVVGVIILFTDAFTSQVLKPLVGRLRPSNLENPISHLVHIVDGHRGGRYGFPSSHSANCWGVAFFVAYLFRHRVITLFMFVWAFIVCWSRLYLGVHYVGDVFFGMLFGLVGASVLYYVFRKITNHTPQQPLRYAELPVAVGLLTIACIVVLSFFIRF